MKIKCDNEMCLSNNNKGYCTLNYGKKRKLKWCNARTLTEFTKNKEVEMKIRNANIDDMEWIRKLSNTCLKYMFRDKPIGKIEHEKWFNKNIRDIKVIGNKLGTYWILKDYITIRLFPKYRNKGIGTEVLKNINGKSIIFFDNLRSLNAHKKAGFKITGYLMEKNED